MDNHTPPKKFTPNHISAPVRLACVIVSCGAIAYGSYGLWIDDLYLPGKRGPGVHFNGLGAWLVFAAICCMAANLISIVVDHFDKRDNERHYKFFALATIYIGVGFWAAAIIVSIASAYAAQ